MSIGFWDDATFGRLVSYETDTCPHCGGKAKHPYTGNVTSEQLDEDANSCILMECIDEGRSTVGYKCICKSGKSSFSWLDARLEECVNGSNKEFSKKY